MAFVHGKSGVLKLQNAAGTVVDVSVYIKSAGFPRSREKSETTTFGAVNKTYIPGVTDASLNVEGLYDPAFIAILDGIATMASRSWEYGPEGSTTGQKKYSGTGFVENYEVGNDVGEAVSVSFTIQPDAQITTAVY